MFYIGGRGFVCQIIEPVTFACLYLHCRISHWADTSGVPYEREFYIGGSTLLCQFIEPVTFARCTFIFALRNIALGGYLDTRRNI